MSQCFRDTSDTVPYVALHKHTELSFLLTKNRREEAIKNGSLASSLIQCSIIKDCKKPNNFKRLLSKKTVFRSCLQENYHSGRASLTKHETKDTRMNRIENDPGKKGVLGSLGLSGVISFHYAGILVPFWFIPCYSNTYLYFVTPLSRTAAQSLTISE